MYDLHLFPTPNGFKPLILLEELEASFSLHLVDINNGDQFQPKFIALSPNCRIPAMVDNQPNDSDEPLSMFESGMILQYLAEKHSQFLPTTTRERAQVLCWLYWQIGGLGPMLGQNHHFAKYAPEKIPYAVDRYVNETKRLYEVLNYQIGNKSTICDHYSIADMASYPWCRYYEQQSINLNDYPNVERWINTMSQRDAVQRAYEKGDALVK